LALGTEKKKTRGISPPLRVKKNGIQFLAQKNRKTTKLWIMGQKSSETPQEKSTMVCDGLRAGRGGKEKG